MNPSVLNSLASGNPIRKLYQKAIDLAQGGKPDNDAKQFRYYVLHQLAWYALTCHRGFNVVECGCWHGHSTLLIAHLMRMAEPASRVQPSLAGRLHVFDSFKGLSEFKAQDRSDTFNTTAKREAERVHYASNFQKMCQLVEPFGFVGVHKGWIPEVFEGINVGQLSFAMIDVDLYEPTLASLKFVYPNLVPGGAIFFDDYGYRNFPGAKIAVDEFLAGLKTPPMLFIENPMGSAYLVK